VPFENLMFLGLDHVLGYENERADAKAQRPVKKFGGVDH